MKSFKVLSVVLVIMGVFTSCTDIIDCEANYDKDYLFKMLSPADSLKALDIRELDFGSIKMMGASTKNVRIINNSDTLDVFVYSLAQANKTGIFTYSFPDGFPVVVKPGEDTEVSGKIAAKFNAGTYNTGYYYDTLFINGSSSIFIPVRAYVRY